MTRAERAAVADAIAETEQLVDGAERLQLLDPVLWKRTHTYRALRWRFMCPNAPHRSGTGNLFALWGKKEGFYEKVCVPEPNLTFTIRA